MMASVAAAVTSTAASATSSASVPLHRRGSCRRYAGQPRRHPRESAFGGISFAKTKTRRDVPRGQSQREYLF
jgi:hypothetical protein